MFKLLESVSANSLFKPDVRMRGKDKRNIICNLFNFLLVGDGTTEVIYVPNFYVIKRWSRNIPDQALSSTLFMISWHFVEFQRNIPESCALRS